MTDPIERAVAVAEMLRGVPVTQESIDRAFRALDAAELRTNLSSEEDDVNDKANNYAPPDPYAAGLAQLRAATATPLSTFEDQYKASRLRELAAEYDRAAAHLEVNPSPRLTAAEATEYAAPNPYEAGLKALRAKKTR